MGLDVGYLYEHAEEFFEKGRKTSIAEDVQRGLALERERQGPIDLDKLRDAENWSYLASRVVGFGA